MSQLVQQKISELDRALTEFTMHPGARILLLHATDNDFKVAYHFLSMRAEYKIESADVIVLADAPFTTAHQFADQAVVALCQAYDRLKPLLPIKDPEADLPDWQPEFIADESETGVQRLERLTQEMVRLYGDYFDKLVLFLIPPTVMNTQEWRSFITQISGMTDNKIRFGVIENLTPFEPVQQALQLPETQIVLYSFQGQSFDMMLGVLDELEHQDELVDYRRYLTQTFQYQSEQAPEKALNAAQSALQIAQQQQLKEAQVVALTAMYATSVSLKDYQQAQHLTRQALAVAQTVTTEELPARNQLEAMAYTNLATAEFLGRRYDLAADSYQAAACLFQHQENWMMTYENLRMRVLCLTRLEHFDKAWASGGDALVAVYQTPEALWQNGTLAYFGKNMLHLCPWQEKAEQTVFEAHMADLLGEPWQQLTDAVEMPDLPPQQEGSIA
ncbi:hypothetical protein VA7868_02206 [Vibrio aerogenes CECT 7868]|uniref:Tetratricopeptide repeat protein n=1 Tax=Vibrio aerogenes CECT 7868 TaxID=1216006 RepID=A0A1M5Z2I7_9VIBR|nr:hypothetical protein [Vibrio aerogenes]SHI18334.1 hypothetical protein VA7868_02206 [Vibrio aerogenes CECT 7868]